MESIEALSRRAFLQTALLGGAASLAFPRSSQAQGEPCKFGLTPVFLSNDLELLGRLRPTWSQGSAGRSNWCHGGLIRRSPHFSCPARSMPSWEGRPPSKSAAVQRLRGSLYSSAAYESSLVVHLEYTLRERSLEPDMPCTVGRFYDS
jgi:hypothetical protein